MRRRINRWLPLAVLCFGSGCATNRANTLLFAGAAGIVGGGAGYFLTPKDEKPEMHAFFGSAIGVAIAGIAGLFLFDEQKRSDELERQATVMRRELDTFRGEGNSETPRLLYETTAPFGREVPGEYQNLVRPGRWSVYQLNQWVSQGEGTMIHQDRMVKLIPAQLNPKTSNSFGGEVGTPPITNGGGESTAPPKPVDSNKEKL